MTKERLKEFFKNVTIETGGRYTEEEVKDAVDSVITMLSAEGEYIRKTDVMAQTFTIKGEESDFELIDASKIRQLQTVTVINDDWIPMSNGELPKVADVYLVTIKEGENDPGVVRDAYFSDGKFMMASINGSYDITDKITAWREKPKAYTGGKTWTL